MTELEDKDLIFTDPISFRLPKRKCTKRSHGQELEDEERETNVVDLTLDDDVVEDNDPVEIEKNKLIKKRNAECAKSNPPALVKESSVTIKRKYKSSEIHEKDQSDAVLKKWKEHNADINLLPKVKVQDIFLCKRKMKPADQSHGGNHTTSRTSEEIKVDSVKQAMLPCLKMMNSPRKCSCSVCQKTLHGRFKTNQIKLEILKLENIKDRNGNTTYIGPKIEIEVVKNSASLKAENAADLSTPLGPALRPLQTPNGQRVWTTAAQGESSGPAQLTLKMKKSPDVQATSSTQLVKLVKKTSGTEDSNKTDDGQINLMTTKEAAADSELLLPCDEDQARDGSFTDTQSMISMNDVSFVVKNMPSDDQKSVELKQEKHASAEVVNSCELSVENLTGFLQNCPRMPLVKTEPVDADFMSQGSETTSVIENSSVVNSVANFCNESSSTESQNPSCVETESLLTSEICVVNKLEVIKGEILSDDENDADTNNTKQTFVRDEQTAAEDFTLEQKSGSVVQTVRNEDESDDDIAGVEQNLCIDAENARPHTSKSDEYEVNNATATVTSPDISKISDVNDNSITLNQDHIDILNEETVQSKVATSVTVHQNYNELSNDKFSKDVSVCIAMDVNDNCVVSHDAGEVDVSSIEKTKPANEITQTDRSLNVESVTSDAVNSSLLFKGKKVKDMMRKTPKPELSDRINSLNQRSDTRNKRDIVGISAAATPSINHTASLHLGSADRKPLRSVKVRLHRIQADPMGNLFICLPCDKTFYDVSSFHEHSKTHITAKSIRCQLCHERFPNVDYYNLHACQPKNYKHKCLLCGRKYFHLKTLEKHEQSCNLIRKFDCEICGRGFLFKWKLDRHMVIHSNDPKPFTCEICGRGCLTMSALVAHKRIHAPEREFRCPTCGRTFRIEHRLQEHMVTHTGIKPFTCNLCGKSFAKKMRYDIHIDDHNGVAKKFQCEYCSYKCNVKADLTKHTQIHTAGKPYKCPQCDKSFLRGAHLKNHMPVHTGERRFKCKICAKSFKFRSAYDDHRNSHTDERRFKCDICHKAFKIWSTLKRHKKMHTDVKPFECSICNKKFALNGLYKLHLRFGHPSEEERLKAKNKEYKCEICGKGFSELKYCRNHLRIHTGEKPYKCPYCDRRFTFSQSLLTHKRVHTGEKPKTCNVCGKRFALNSSLRVHLQTHCKEKPYSCTDCGMKFATQVNMKKHKAYEHCHGRECGCTRCRNRHSRNLQEKMSLDPVPT